MNRERGDTPISTLVVDDEELARELIKSLVRKDPDLLLAGECADGVSALRTITAEHPDLVFLDIRMPGIDGVAVAERLQDVDPQPYVIFTTAFDEYAIRAFELDVLDYLVKPISKPRFRESVRRAKSAIRSNEIVSLSERLIALNRARARTATRSNGEVTIVVRKGDNVVELSSREIVWLEAANQYVHIHTTAGNYTVSESLGTYAKKLPDRGFVRIHRSAVVNCERILSIRRNRNGTHELELTSGDRLTLSRSRTSLLPVLLKHARENRHAGDER
jgi:two-component system LytT family response regulator